MHNDFDAMIIHKHRMNKLYQEAHDHQLAKLAQGTKLTLWDRFREFVTSINAKLSVGPAYSNVDCALVPAQC